jgi:hypothetical protein
MRSPSFNTASRRRPDRAAADDDDGLLRLRDESGSLFHRCRVQRAGAMRLERRGRTVRLVVVPLLLLHVHRTAQHDRTPLELCLVEGAAHRFVGELARIETDEPRLDAVGEA